MKKALIFLRTFLAVSVLFGSVAFADMPAKEKGKQDAQALAKTTGYEPDRYQILNINNLTTWSRHDGQSNHSPTGDNGLFYPRGTKWVIYQDGMVYGSRAYVDQAKTKPAPFSQITRVNGTTYGVGTRQGWVTGSGATAAAIDPADLRARTYRVRRDWQDMSSDDLRRDAAESSEIAVTTVSDAQAKAIAERYAKDWKEWPVDLGAPYIDRNKNGRYDPPPAGFTTNDLIDKKYDEPGVAGSDPNSPADQVIWCVFNDLNRATTTARFGSEPSGMEIQATIWGYKRSDALGNVYFRKWRFINKGGVEIDAAKNKGVFYHDSMYVCQWSDPDLGEAGDDLAGCDVDLSMGFIYNGNAVDLEFRKVSLPPPSSGYDFLQGPIIPAPGQTAVFDLKYRSGYKNLGMTGFSYFSAGSAYTDPIGGYATNTILWYKMLRGFAPLQGPDVPYTFPPGVTPGPFPLAGDPVKKTGHIDGQGTGYSFVPGDRRILAITGPFKMAPGDTQEVVVAGVVGLGSDRLSSVSVLKFNDRFAQATYNALFQVPRPPIAPDVKVAQLDGQIVLEWGSNLTRVKDTETTINNPGGYKFEGYNVYQLPTAAASLKDGKRLATYDLLEDPAVILDDAFDPSSGQILTQPVQFGSNSGLVRYFKFDRDYLKDVNKLNNGEEYYIAVTAYSQATVAGQVPLSLESSPKVLTVVPQSPRLGERYPIKFGENPGVTHTGKSDGSAVPAIIDPTVTSGQTYKVTFKNIPTTFVYGPDSKGDRDTVTVTIMNWFLTRGSTVIYQNSNLGPAIPISPGTENLAEEFLPVFGDIYQYPIIDGFRLPVAGPPPQLNADRSALKSGTNWLRAANGRFAGSTSVFNGQVTTAHDVGSYLGATGPGVDAGLYRDIEFRFGDGGSLTQKGYRYRRIGTYQFQNYTDVPFQVWDVSGATPRQLNVGWRDNNNNGKWDPISGGVEVIFVATSTYDGDNPTTFTYGTTVGEAVNTIVLKDFQYLAEWISANGVQADIKQSVIRVSPNYVLTESDVFTFTPPAVTKSAELAKQDLAKVGVFPNPYLGQNPQETNKLSRFVTFNNLPDKATLRVFNLAGQLVRTIEHDGGAFQQWNLLNFSNLPVASGLYIVHIEMPGLGQKVLKVAVVQEQEVLDTF